MSLSNQNLLPWINEILENVTPKTNDQEVLNLLTSKQISDSSYLENVDPAHAFDANFIVPKSLYESTINQVWRYPPHIYTDFIVKNKDDLGIKIKIRLAIPRYLQYGEKKYSESKGGISRGIQVNPTLELPAGFGSINIFNQSYEMESEGKFKAITIQPELFEIFKEINLNKLNESGGIDEIILDQEEVKIVIKKFDASSNEVIFYDPKTQLGGLGYESIKKVDNKNIKLGYVELVKGKAQARLIIKAQKLDQENHYKISIRLVNEIEYKKERPKTSEWSKSCLILPHFLIRITNGEINIPLQQHFESLEYVIKNNEKKLAEDYEKELNSYTQINGVLTRSTTDKNTLCFSMFGVYDTIREYPTPGPSLSTILKDDNSLFANLYLLNEEEKQKLRSEKNYLFVIKSVLKAASAAFNVTDRFHKFQWDAIQNRIKIILQKNSGTTAIIKAPTASGKTLIFMVNAALHSLLLNQRSVLVFPTRILNEDMFRRLTKFVYELRKEIKEMDFTGGIYIGQSDPLYSAISNPPPGKVMVQFYVCPACDAKGSIIATKYKGDRVIGKCSNTSCRHEISYMFGPREVTDYLPLITIATPDNLFYRSTAAGSEPYNIRMFGGYFIKCSCGNCQPPFPMDDKGSQKIECRKCYSQLDSKNKQRSPIGYFVFDEVHSLYGLTGILLSIYLKSIEIAANKIEDINYFNKPLKWQSTFETGTATIANEAELLKAITRTSDEKISKIPENRFYYDYFKPDPTKVKYRTVVILPIARSSRTSVSNSILRLYYSLHLDNDFRNAINRLSNGAYEFILGYLFRKRDGYQLLKTIRDLANEQLNQELDLEFFSGEASPAKAAEFINKAKSKDIKMLLANLVISLGIDIENMNNIVMLGMPKSMTEFVQTAGRTGRGSFPGHNLVHLLPSNPRDMYTFENFHRVFSDISGYLETKPMTSTNAYAAKIILPNIVKFMLSAHSYHKYVLTIPYASNYFYNPNNRKALMLDVLKSLIDPNVSESIQKKIHDETKKTFDEYFLKWSKISGKGNYLWGWFQTDGHILWTLRERINKEIIPQVDEIPLYQEITKPYKQSWEYFEDRDDDESDESGTE